MKSFTQTAKVKRLFSSCAAILIGALLFVPASQLIQPSVAHAGIPTFETNPALVGGVIATGVSTGIQASIMQVLNGLAWTVAKMTIQSLTRSTVNWINSGFQGSPAFVSDLNENLRYLGDAVADDFFNQLNQEVINTTGFNLTSPFQDQISQQLRAEYYRTTSGLLGLNEYDLSGHSTDPKAFINGDFSQGGFDAFFSANGNPANNPFGAYRLASNQLFAQIDSAAQQRKSELDWGKGFLPWRGNCTTSNQNITKQVLNAPLTAGGGAPPSLSKAETCRGSTVKTPGSVIESQLELSLGSGIRQLELADSINEIVGALMGQLVNQVLGAGGLFGVSQPSSGGGSSYLDQATSASQYNSSTSGLSDGVLQGIRNDISNFEDVRDGWQRVLGVANAAQQKCSANTEITDAIARATTGISKANVSLQAITGIQQEVQSAVSSTAVNKSTLVTTAITSYQSFLAAPTTPSAAEISAAARESIDTSGTPEAKQSIYSRMVALQNNCGA